MTTPQKQVYSVRSEKEEWLGRIIRKAQEEKFFGTLSIQFKEGAMVMIEKTETLKPPS